MKKKNSRFFRHFAILFAAAFAVHFFPGVSVPVKAADIEISLPGVVGGTLTFDESTGTITGCSPAVTSAEIPPEINGVTVLEVGANAFASCRQLTKISFSEGLFIVPFGAFSGCSSLELVSFPASLEFLDQWAFLNCSNLKTIEISPLNETYTVQDNILYTKDRKTLLFCPSGRDTPVRSIPEQTIRIDQNAFSSCAHLSEIILPHTIQEIGIAAFSGCSALPKLNLPESLKKIEDYAFLDCTSFKHIVIPENVTEIGYGAFSGCISLQSISVSPKNPTYTALDDILYTKDKKTLLLCPEGQTLTVRSIPSSVERIESLAFHNCQKLEQISIPASVTELGNTVFSSCPSLKNITIPSTVSTCGSNLFSFCPSLETVDFLASVSELEYQMFQSCFSLQTVTLSGTIKKIGSEAFFSCQSLSTLVFRGTEESWNGVTIEEEGNDILQNVEISFLPQTPIEVSLPGVIGGTLTFDESTGTIVDCSENVTSVEIPSEINGVKVTAIGKDAFSYCSHLKKLTIPEGITTIEDHAFGCCTALTNIICLPV